MKRRTFVLGSAAVILGGTGFISGTASYSTSRMERDVVVEVVADRHALLSLREGEESTNENDVLFEDANYREAPVSFTVANKSSSPIDITITLEPRDGGQLFQFLDFNTADVYTDYSAGEYANCEIGLGPGDSQQITVDLRDYRHKAENTIRFDGNDDGGLYMHAVRTLKLRPEELAADVRLDDTASPIEIYHPDPDDVNFDSVEVEIDGDEVDTEIVNGEIEIVYDDGEEVGCEDTDDTVDVDVFGETDDGYPFSATVSDVNCVETG